MHKALRGRMGCEPPFRIPMLKLIEAELAAQARRLKEIRDLV
jgi:hypothetical protein